MGLKHDSILWSVVTKSTVMIDIIPEFIPSTLKTTTTPPPKIPYPLFPKSDVGSKPSDAVVGKWLRK